MLDVKLCRGANSDSDLFLVRGRHRCKIAYSKYEPNRIIVRSQQRYEVPAASGRII